MIDKRGTIWGVHESEIRAFVTRLRLQKNIVQSSIPSDDLRSGSVISNKIGKTRWASTYKLP